MMALLQLVALATVGPGDGQQARRRLTAEPGALPGWTAPPSPASNAAPTAIPTTPTAVPAAPAAVVTPPQPPAQVPAAKGNSARTTAPVVADDPAGLARQLASAEAAVADPATPPGELAAMAHLQQLIYRKLVARPEWKPDVMAAIPAPFVASAEANFTAAAKLRSMIKRPKEKLPPWRIVAPAPPEELLGYYLQAEKASGVPWQYLAAIHLVETRMGRIRGTSSAGAQGPMQFMPATWAAYGKGDVNSNRDAISAAARYLRHNGAPAEMRKALWNYNHDYRYVDAVTLHAERMKADRRAFFGYYHWQVYYFTATGDIWLPEGYGS